MSFFEDSIPPFIGIDMGYEGDPNMPVGDYEVVVDSPVEESQTHDFKITVADDGAGGFDITVAAGQVWSNIAQADSNGDAVLTRYASTVAETVFSSVSTSTTKGIWLKSSVSAGSNYPALFGDVGKALQEGFSTHAVIGDDTNNSTTTAHLAAIAASTAAQGYTFIGSVDITAGGVVTITQKVKGPIDAPNFQYLTDVLSNAGGNDIYLASDGLFLSLATSGSGINIADDGAGTYTFSNTGVTSIVDSSTAINIDQGTGTVTFTDGP